MAKKITLTEQLEKEKQDYNKAILAGYKLYTKFVEKNINFTTYESLVLDKSI